MDQGDRSLERWLEASLPKSGLHTKAEGGRPWNGFLCYRGTPPAFSDSAFLGLVGVKVENLRDLLSDKPNLKDRRMARTLVTGGHYTNPQLPKNTQSPSVTLT